MNSINTLEGWNALALEANSRAFEEEHGRPPVICEEATEWARKLMDEAMAGGAAYMAKLKKKPQFRRQSSEEDLRLRRAIKAYIIRTALPESVVNRYRVSYREMNMLMTLIDEGQHYCAISAAFSYGLAKGWRAARRSRKRANTT